MIEGHAIQWYRIEASEWKNFIHRTKQISIGEQTSLLQPHLADPEYRIFQWLHQASQELAEEVFHVSSIHQ